MNCRGGTPAYFLKKRVKFLVSVNPVSRAIPVAPGNGPEEPGAESFRLILKRLRRGAFQEKGDDPVKKGFEDPQLRIIGGNGKGDARVELEREKCGKALLRGGDDAFSFRRSLMVAFQHVPARAAFRPIRKFELEGEAFKDIAGGKIKPVFHPRSDEDDIPFTKMVSDVSDIQNALPAAAHFQRPDGVRMAGSGRPYFSIGENVPRDLQNKISSGGLMIRIFHERLLFMFLG